MFFVSRIYESQKSFSARSHGIRFNIAIDVEDSTREQLNQQITFKRQIGLKSLLNASHNYNERLLTALQEIDIEK